MKIAAILPGLLLAAAIAEPAAAQPLVQQLAGKTCQGTFSSGRHREASEGALQLRFAAVAGRLTAQAWRLVGTAAFDRAAYALTQKQPVDPSGYEALGEIRGLAVSGDKLRYIDPLGARVTLEYKDGDLSGESDPRGGSDPRMTRLQFVNLHCW
jgi:hypothetical protein